MTWFVGSYPQVCYIYYLLYITVGMYTHNVVTHNVIYNFETKYE